MSVPHRSLRALAAALLALTACKGNEPTALVRPPALEYVLVDSVTVGARLRIRVHEPTTVQVRYDAADAAPALAVTTTLSSSDSMVVLTRLVRGQTYQYSAAAVAADGSLGPATTGQFTTPSLPADLASLRFDALGDATEPLLLLEVRASSGFNGFVAVDERGEIVWYFRTVGAAQGSTRRANGNFVLNDLGAGLREVTPNGDVVRRYDYTGDVPAAHHDVAATAANTVLFIAHDVRTQPGGGAIAGEAVYEWTPETGAVAKRWTAWDWYDPAVDWGPLSYDSDWLHANSLAIGPHGNVILSFNFISQVISVAPDWSKLEWRLGGRNSDFAVDTDAVFSGQHTASMPAEGHVLMFDNGRARPDGSAFSRGLELQLDSAQKRARTVWEFRPAASIYAPYLGSARRLENGNTVVFFGLPSGPFGGLDATGPVSAYEVTPARAIVWNLDVGNALSAYRGTPLSAIGAEKIVP